jgi:hypothetical protein
MLVEFCLTTKQPQPPPFFSDMSPFKNVEILTNLEEDPHVAFFAWELDVYDVAAGMAKSIHRQGLLSHILTDEQWAAYPGNAVPDQNGNK